MCHLFAKTLRRRIIQSKRKNKQILLPYIRGIG